VVAYVPTICRCLGGSVPRARCISGTRRWGAGSLGDARNVGVPGGEADHGGGPWACRIVGLVPAARLRSVFSPPAMGGPDRPEPGPEAAKTSWDPAGAA